METQSCWETLSFPPETKRPNERVDIVKCPLGLRCPLAQGSHRQQDQPHAAVQGGEPNGLRYITTHLVAYSHTNFLFYSSVCLKSGTGLTGLKSNIDRTVFLLEALGNVHILVFFFSFQRPAAFLGSSPLPPSSRLTKVSQVLFLLQHSDVVCLLLPLKGSTQITQDVLPNLKALKRTTSAKSLCHIR